MGESLPPWRSSAPPTTAFRVSPATTSSPTTRRSTACACTTSTRARGGRSSASTASRPGPTSIARCCRRCRAAGHRVVCADYAGFGRSDKPTDRGWYSYDRHVELRLGGARRPRPQRRRRGGPGLGRADRAALGGRERRPGRRAGRSSTRDLHRAGLEGLHGMARVRREEPRPSRRVRAPGRDHDRAPSETWSRPTRRPSRPRSRRPARRSSRCWSRSPRTTPVRRAACGECRGRAGPLGEAGAGGLLGHGPDVLPYPRAGERFIELIHGRERAGEDRGRGPLPAGGPRRADR